jgi:hypothetical protein
MKQKFLHLKTLAILLAVVSGLSSCGDGGGGSKLSENEFLGNSPAIISDYLKGKAEYEAWEKKKAKELEDSKDAKAFMAAMAEGTEKKEALEKQVKDGLATELAKVKGKEVPVVNENPGIKVSALKMENINDKVFFLKGKVTAKTSAEGANAVWVKCQLQDKDGNVLQEKNGEIKVNYSGFGKIQVPAGEYDFSLSFDLVNSFADPEVLYPEVAKMAKVVVVK